MHFINILNFEEVVSGYNGPIPQKSKDCFYRWLPLIQNSEMACEFAYIVGKVTGDGNLDQLFTSRFIGQYKEDLEALKELLANKFGIKRSQMTIRERFSKGRSYLLQVNNSAFGRTLYALGAPKGNKIKTNFLVPRWIMVSVDSSRYFLQALLEDELTTIKVVRKAHVKTIRINMRKSYLFSYLLKEAHFDLTFQVFQNFQAKRSSI